MIWQTGFLLEILKNVTKTRDSDLRLRIYEQLKKLYHETQHYKLAYSYSNSFFNLKDSIYGMAEREMVIRVTHANIYAEKSLQDSLVNVDKERITQLNQNKEDQLTNSILQISFYK